MLAERCAGDHAPVDRRAVYVEVAVCAGRAAIGIVEEINGCGMAAGGECSEHVERLCLTCPVQGGRGLSATDLMAIDKDRELSVAQIGILGDLQRQRVGAGADRVMESSRRTRAGLE